MIFGVHTMIHIVNTAMVLIHNGWRSDGIRTTDINNNNSNNKYNILWYDPGIVQIHVFNTRIRLLVRPEYNTKPYGRHVVRVFEIYHGFPLSRFRNRIRLR